MHGDERVPGLDALDERIDAALRSYAEPGEIPEARVVLARVRERAAVERRRRAWWWIGAVGVAACAAVLVIVGLVMMRGPRRAEIAWVPQAPGVIGGVTSAPAHAGTGAKARLSSGALSARLKSCSDTKPCPGAAGEAVAREASTGVRGRREDVFEESRLPKDEVFPTPRPLSAEEQALVEFATRTPPKVREQVVEAQKHVGDPIVIADLKIAPLQLDEGQDSKRER